MKTTTLTWQFRLIDGVIHVPMANVVENLILAADNGRESGAEVAAMAIDDLAGGVAIALVRAHEQTGN